MLDEVFFREITIIIRVKCLLSRDRAVEKLQNMLAAAGWVHEIIQVCIYALLTEVTLGKSITDSGKLDRCTGKKAKISS